MLKYPLLATLLGLLACGPKSAQITEPGFTRTRSGLQYMDLKEGTGLQPRPGQTAIVHYTGWLRNGRKFDSSLDRDKPFSFVLGRGQVIKAWDEGVATMKLGGKRRLIVPSDLGYGRQGRGSTIPPNATLEFEIELLGVR